MRVNLEKSYSKMSLLPKHGNDGSSASFSFQFEEEKSKLNMGVINHPKFIGFLHPKSNMVV